MSQPTIASVGEHGRIGLTSRYLTRDGQPWIPVSGELHYSRVPRERWRERLALMRSGGIDVVSSYVIWIHHQPEPGPASFAGNLDVAAFVRLCAELGLDVVLRIGPWAHGEVRNGGFPDWVQQAPVAHRSDDPAYLDLVRAWFGRLGQELAELCGPESAIIGIQIENELCDQPEHLRTLKTMAREAGLSAPLWTATAWGGAELPKSEFLPVYSGYGDGFWVDADAGWEDSFRQHFFFSRQWDDPGVGADVRGEAVASAPRPRDESCPPVTCELGGGMASAYHRRPAPHALDIAAIANAKLGSGSAWQGYYMYAGGLNPPGPESMSESHATGYPNDMPRFDYDFHAPIGASGRLSPAHAALRAQHTFIESFGAALATMPASFPYTMPNGLDDGATLRWALRSDGDSGFVFINWHQPHVPLPTVCAVRLEVELADQVVQIGSRPIDIPAGTVARWPLGLDVGGVRVHWATGSALAMPDSATLVLVAERGIDVEICSGRDRRVHRVDWRTGGSISLPQDGGLAHVIVIGHDDRERVWIMAGGRDSVLRCDHPLWLEDGRLSVRSGRPPVLEAWSPTTMWRPVELIPDGPARPARPVGFDLVRAADEPRVDYGWFAGRPSAPQETDLARGALYRLRSVGRASERVRRELQVDWAGDVAQLLVDDVVVADRFWDGTPWHVDLDVLNGAEDERVSLRILPLHPDAQIWLPADAQDRRRASADPLMALDAVTLTHSAIWHSRK